MNNQDTVETVRIERSPDATVRIERSRDGTCSALDDTVRIERSRDATCSALNETVRIERSPDATVRIERSRDATCSALNGTVRIERSRDATCGSIDDLVTRLYRAALSIKDAGWQALLKNAAFSLSAAQRPSSLVAAIALIDTVLVLAEHAHHLDAALTTALRTNLRAALSEPQRVIEPRVSASAR